MTGIDVGLPASPIVDRNRNLTPEWLYTLSKIERLNSLKDELARIEGGSLDALEAALASAKAAVEAVGLAPNNVLFSIVPYTATNVTTTGVAHDLGTADYIALDCRDTFCSIISYASTSMPIRNDSIWTLTPDPAAPAGPGWLTVTAIIPKGPQQ